MITSKKALLLLAVTSALNAQQSVDGQAAALYAKNIVDTLAGAQKEGATSADTYKAMLNAFEGEGFAHNWSECSDKARRAGKKGCAELIYGISNDPLVHATTVQAEIRFDGAEKTTEQLLEEKRRSAVFVCANVLKEEYKTLQTKFSNYAKQAEFKREKDKELEKLNSAKQNLETAKQNNNNQSDIAALQKEIEGLENKISTLDGSLNNKLSEKDYEAMKKAPRSFLQEQLQKGRYAQVVAREAHNFEDKKSDLLNKIASVVTEQRNRATKDDSTAAADLEVLAYNLTDILAKN